MTGSAWDCSRRAVKVSQLTSADSTDQASCHAGVYSDGLSTRDGKRARIHPKSTCSRTNSCRAMRWASGGWVAFALDEPERDHVPAIRRRSGSRVPPADVHPEPRTAVRQVPYLGIRRVWLTASGPPPAMSAKWCSSAEPDWLASVAKAIGRPSWRRLCCAVAPVTPRVSRIGRSTHRWSQPQTPPRQDGRRVHRTWSAGRRATSVVAFIGGLPAAEGGCMEFATAASVTSGLTGWVLSNRAPRLGRRLGASGERRFTGRK